MPFDIRAAVAEVPTSLADDVQPTVRFTFNIALAKRVKDLRAAEKLDEKAIAAAEAELEAATYVADLVSVSRGRREEIVAKALDKFPAKPSVFGQDEKASYLRGNYVRVAVVAAGIMKITDPKGEALDEDEHILDAVQYIHDEAPDQVFETIERATQKLNEEKDEQDVLHKTADF